MEVFTIITLFAFAPLLHARFIFNNNGDCTSSAETYLGTAQDVYQCEKLCKQKMGDNCIYFTFAASGAGGCYYEPSCTTHNDAAAWKGYKIVHSCPGSTPWGSTKGYILRTGDVPGWGIINGKGGGKRVVNCDACADLCSSEAQCRSYECSAHTLLCNLNTEWYPTTNQNYQDYVFCAKTGCPGDSFYMGPPGVCIAGAECIVPPTISWSKDSLIDINIETRGFYEKKDYLLLGALVSNMILMIALATVCCKRTNQSSVNAYKKVRNENYSSQDEENELIQ